MVQCQARAFPFFAFFFAFFFSFAFSTLPRKLPTASPYSYVDFRNSNDSTDSNISLHHDDDDEWSRRINNGDANRVTPIRTISVILIFILH